MNANHNKALAVDDGNLPESIDWSLTTWEGARREQMRRWAAMPLAEMIFALEEMQELAQKLSPTDTKTCKG